ncbi:MAG TPA: nitroreductase/quinone reductase family protein [Actinotalea sp.]|jgi:deazaflavin-dependent oxidoreductase (nitroreductase family)
MGGIVRRIMRAANAMSVATYRRSGGRLGGTARGVPVLLLTVRGRSSGTPRTAPVAYFDHGGAYLVVGSGGGMKAEPQWMRNLRVAQTAHIRVGRDERDVEVRITDPAERDELWRTVVVARAPSFAAYEQKSGRTIPIAVLTPTST